MGFEHILVLVAEIGTATGVFYGLFNYLFKNAFNDSIVTLKEAVDSLSSNVDNQTKMLAKSLEQVEKIEEQVNDHETRLKVVEYEQNRKDK